MIKRIWNKIKKEQAAWYLVLLFAVVILLASCQWQSPADKGFDKYSVEHIHGPHCDHTGFKRGLI